MVSFIIRYSLSMSCNQIQAQSSILKKVRGQPNPLAASRHSFFPFFISLGVADNSIFIASGWLSVGSSTHRKCVPKPSFTFSATRYRIPSKSNQNNNNNTCKNNNVSNCGILCEMWKSCGWSFSYLKDTCRKIMMTPSARSQLLLLP